MSYSSYSKNSTFPPPSGGGENPDPCPPGRLPQVNGKSQVIVNLSDDFAGGGFGQVFLAEFLAGASPQGAYLPPCSPSINTSGDPMTWDFYLTDNADVTIPPSAADTAMNGLYNQYTVTCADLGLVSRKAYADNGFGVDFAAVDLLVTDTLGVCP